MTRFLLGRCYCLLVLLLRPCDSWMMAPSLCTHCPRVATSSLYASSSPSLLLENVVCLVTGASRGIGKGVALELAKQGATVYVTGTTVSDLQATADAVNQAGGKGTAVVCDHANDAQVQSLFEQIQAEQNRLDLLVNNAFRLPSLGVERLQQKFWQQGAEAWDAIHQVGLRSHYVASCYAMPLMFQSIATCQLPRPLVFMISSFGGLTYSFNVAYGVGKAGLDRLAKDMAVDIGDRDVSVISLWPGLVYTENTKQLVESGDYEKYVGLPLDNAETPAFTGRAVVALALDPNNKSKTGTFQVVAELAEEYQFTDVDGTVPPSIRSLKFLLPAYGGVDLPPSKIPDIKLPFWIMAQGKPPETES